MSDLVAASPKVDWAAIVAGAVLTTSTALILLAFGGAIGLSAASPFEGEGFAPSAYAIGAGLWLLWVHLLSFTIGGYAAARLRRRDPAASEHETDVQDGMHGLLVWGAGVIVAAAIAAAGLGGATATVRTAQTASDPAASVAAAAAEELAEGEAAERAENPQARAAEAEEVRAEIARKTSVIAAFITAASFLAGAVAAFFAAGVGGRHRDQNTRLAFFELRR